MSSSRAQRGVRPVLVLIAVAAVPAVALLALWRFAADRDVEPEPLALLPDDVPSEPPAAALPTGLMSFRRVPRLLSRDLSLDELRGEVDGFAQTLNDESCVSASLEGIDAGSRRGGQSLIPASAQKLLVASAALDRLGVRHRFVTTVKGAVDSAGTVGGDLFLVGGGDPLLTSEEFPVENDAEPVFNATSLNRLADAVVAAGVERVDGNVVGDGSRYDDEFFAPTWIAADRGLEAGPVDALLVNDARITGDPVRGSDPSEAAAREFARLLADRGIVIGGVPSAGVAPRRAPVLASVRSVPLPDVVAEMLTNSDNNTAEMLLKELGHQATGAPGAREAGALVVYGALSSWGVDVEGVVLADGSGLSTDNRLTCDVLLAVLARGRPGGPIGRALAVAGETGTLSDVFTESPVAGRLRAKTGTLQNAPFNADPPAVKSLAGYLPVDGGDTIEFALVLNGPTINDQAEYRPVWDALATTLDSYPAGPSAEELGPLDPGGAGQ
jgi:D-alanyl-D-alanine carboxypeptidase/D-alanyl-D-alanine-endopeptidase (penicillin-binding protein 4)